MNIAIVVVGHNRPNALKLLFESLNKIHCTHEIPLIISIDNNGTPEVNELVQNFNWKFGPKEVIIHDHKKGLVKHFIWTGDQTERFDTVIFLEDDLYVSLEIVNYVEQVAEFYKDDDRVAAASLYHPFINEMTYTRFYPIEDGYDNYFFQQPYWGHVWFRKPWKVFQEYLKTYEVKREYLPTGIANWEKSFKKIFIQFLVETGRYVVTPRVSYLTNNGIPGLHTGEREKCFQCNIALKDKAMRFSSLDQSLAIYDSSYELVPAVIKRFNPALADYDFSVDVNGTKTKYDTPYVLTTKPVKKNLFSFNAAMKPTILSAMMNQEGVGLSLALKEDVIESKKYYSYRRYNDILKNYPVGVATSFQFFGYGMYRFARVIRRRLFNK